MPEQELKPCQRPDYKSCQIPKDVHMMAYEVYSHVWGPQQALIEGSCRGGFHISELIAFLYAHNFPKEQWRGKSDEVLKNSKNI